METLIGILVMALAVIGGILIGVLITSMFYGKNQKKQLRKFPPEDMLKQGFFDETRLWVNPSQNSLITEMDNEFHREFKSLSKDQKRRVGYLQQLWTRWSEEEPTTEPATAPGAGWQYESDVLPATLPILADLEQSIAEKEAQPVVETISGEPAAELAETVLAGTAVVAGAAVVETQAVTAGEQVELAETQVVTPTEEEPVIDTTVETVATEGSITEELADESAEEISSETEPSSEQPATEPAEEIAPELEPASEQPAESVTEQVNLILQGLIQGSGLENERIAIHDDQAEGVVVSVGEQVFHSVEEVPYPQVRQLIKESVLRWKQQQPEI